MSCFFRVLPLLLSLTCAGCAISNTLLSEDDGGPATDAAPLSDSSRPVRVDPPVCSESARLPYTRNLDTDQPLRWSTGACIEVSYDPGLADWRDVIVQGMNAWTSDCSTVCFTGPRSVAGFSHVNVPTTRTIHFYPAEREGAAEDWPEGPKALADLRYMISTSEITTVVIGVRESLGPAAEVVTHQMGHALGIDHADLSVPSAMALDESLVTGDTQCIDELALCEAYRD